MSKLRPARIYRKLELPYTRRSKYKNKSYVKMAQKPKITQFHSGGSAATFDTKIQILSKRSLQIRDNALEAARVVANKYLTDKIGETGFHLFLVKFPHHVLREHKLATGAGADRFSSGMQKSFGKPIGLAAQVHVGDPLFEIYLSKQDVAAGKEAAEKIGKKLGIPVATFILPKDATL